MSIKIEIFTAYYPEELKNKVNKWLSTVPGIKILHTNYSETPLYVPSVSSSDLLKTFIVTYTGEDK